MKTYIFEWTIKDDNGDDHLVKIKKEERNRYIYLDDIKIDMIPNDFHHSEIFNFEYNFSILNKNAKIIYRVSSNTNPIDLFIDGQNVDANGRKNCHVPKLPIYGIISLVLGFVLTFFIEMQVIKLNDPNYILWAICPWGPMLFLRMVINAPIIVQIPKPVAHIIRIIFQAFLVVVLGQMLWYLKTR
ncbi:MAG: hypothetical protein IKB38_10700 [Clostridia bacterium]|nr:hypothetical protein [Clostridia bacterium]MBR2467383.1 hypothetical protein [Clostridia bacterium]